MTESLVVGIDPGRYGHGVVVLRPDGEEALRERVPNEAASIEALVGRVIELASGPGRALWVAEHWIHLRTSNPVESVFAGVRLRTNVSKRMRRRDSALYLVFKITQRLELGWRPLNGGLTLMTLLLRGARFVDGIYIPADVDRPSDPGEEVSAA